MDSPSPAGKPISRNVIQGAVAVVVGALFGLGLHAATARLDHSQTPNVGPLDFSDNGALVLPCCVGPVLTALVVVLLVRRRATVAAFCFTIAAIVAFGFAGPA